MTPEQKVKVTQSYKNAIRSKVEEIVRDACGIYSGENFKRGVPLYELINYKVDNNSYTNNNEKESRKMEYWLDAIDKIIIGTASQWPFIDLEGITQEWNTEQIVFQTLKMFQEAGTNIITFDGTIPKEKNNNAIYLRIEELFKEAVNIPKEHKIKKTERLSAIIKQNMVITDEYKHDGKELKEKIRIANTYLLTHLKDEFPEGDWDNLSMYGWNNISELIKHYKKNNLY